MVLMMWVLQSYCEAGLSPAEAMDYAANSMLDESMKVIAKFRGREYETVRGNVRAAEEQFGVEEGETYRETFRESLVELVSSSDRRKSGKLVRVEATLANGINPMDNVEEEVYGVRAATFGVFDGVGVLVTAPSETVRVGGDGVVEPVGNLEGVLDAVSEEVGEFLGADVGDVPFREAGSQATGVVGEHAEWRMNSNVGEVVLVGLLGESGGEASVAETREEWEAQQ
jgi:hypothetical protein